MIKQIKFGALFLIILLSFVFVTICPNYAVNTTNTQVRVTIQPTISIETFWNNNPASLINLGSFNVTGINTTFMQNETIRTYSNVPINLTVRVSGNLTGTNSSNRFALTDFGYQNGTGIWRSFSTTNTFMKVNWAKAPIGTYNFTYLPMYLNIPLGQDSDTYNCSIYITAIRA